MRNMGKPHTVIATAIFGVLLFSSEIEAGDEYRRLIDEIKEGDRKEYVILQEYFKEIAIVRERHTQPRRNYMRPRLQYEKREMTPLRVREGVTTFRERRSYTYGTRNSRRVR